MPTPRLFVSIAAYRDPDLGATLIWPEKAVLSSRRCRASATDTGRSQMSGTRLGPPAAVVIWLSTCLKSQAAAIRGSQAPQRGSSRVTRSPAFRPLLEIR